MKVYAIVREQVVARVLVPDRHDDWFVMNEWISYRESANPQVGVILGGSFKVEEESSGGPPEMKIREKNEPYKFFMSDKLTDVPFSEWEKVLGSAEVRQIG